MTHWIEISGRLRKVELPAALSTASAGAAAAQRMTCRVDGHPFTVEACMLAPGTMSLLLLDEPGGGRQLRCILEISPEGEAVLIDGDRAPFVVADPRSLRSRRRPAGSDAEGPRMVKAPMPGRVVRVLVAAGDEVAAHQGLVVIEAMKMQNELQSPKAGRVARLAVEVGAAVQTGDVLVVIE